MIIWILCKYLIIWKTKFMLSFPTTDLRANSSSSTVDTTKYQTEITALKTALDKAKSENSSLEKTIASLNEQVASFKSSKDELNEKVNYLILLRWNLVTDFCFILLYVSCCIGIRFWLLILVLHAYLNSHIWLTVIFVFLIYEWIIKSPHSFRKQKTSCVQSGVRWTVRGTTVKRHAKTSKRKPKKGRESWTLTSHACRQIWQAWVRVGSSEGLSGF